LKLLSLLGCLAELPFAPANAQSMCLPSSGLLSHGVQKFTAIVTASDSRTVTLRNQLQLFAANASEVVVVNDSATCQAAATAIAKASTTDPSPRVYPVFVIKIGKSRYVVFGPDYTVGEFFAYKIFDASFRSLAGLAG
jgi:hypothetical protein